MFGIKNRYTFRLQRRNVRQLFLMYACALLYVVFLTPNRYMGEIYTPNLLPFVGSALRIHKPAGEHFWAYYIEYWGNIFGNVILFVPFGFLLSLLYPRLRGFHVVLLGCCTSLCIELTQLLLMIGVCDVDDVLLNTIGALCGVWLWKMIGKRKPAAVSRVFELQD